MNNILKKPIMTRILNQKERFLISIKMMFQFQRFKERFLLEHLELINIDGLFQLVGVSPQLIQPLEKS